MTPRTALIRRKLARAQGQARRRLKELYPADWHRIYEEEKQLALADMTDDERALYGRR